MFLADVFILGGGTTEEGGLEDDELIFLFSFTTMQFLQWY